jgi:hypothetical protein
MKDVAHVRYPRRRPIPNIPLSLPPFVIARAVVGLPALSTAKGTHPHFRPKQSQIAAILLV